MRTMTRPTTTMMFGPSPGTTRPRPLFPPARVPPFSWSRFSPVQWARGDPAGQLLFVDCPLTPSTRATTPGAERQAAGGNSRGVT